MHVKRKGEQRQQYIQHEGGEEAEQQISPHRCCRCVEREIASEGLSGSRRGMRCAARYERPLTMHRCGDAEVCGAESNALGCRETHCNDSA